MNLPNLKRIVIQLWDGDVAFNEAVKKFKPEQLREMEKFIERNLTVYKNGVPFPSELPSTIAHHKSAKLIQKMVDQFE